jgi:hypothetical protein
MTAAERAAKTARLEARIAAEYRSAARAFVASGREATEEQLQDFAGSRYAGTAEYRKCEQRGEAADYWLLVIDGVRRALEEIGVEVLST